MGRSGKAIDAAMFTPAIRVDRPIKRHIGALISGDDTACAVNAKGGLDAWRLFCHQVIKPAIINRLMDMTFKPPVNV